MIKSIIKYTGHLKATHIDKNYNAWQFDITV